MLRSLTMRRQLSATLALVASCAAVMLACGSGSTSVIGQPTGTVGHAPTASPTAARPPAHALAWTQGTVATPANIWASINDAAPAQITSAPPPDGPCLAPETWGYPMFAPDLRHIVVPSAECTTDSQIFGQLYIVTVPGGAIQQVPLPAATRVQTNVRGYGWLNSTTLFAVAWQSVTSSVVTYTLGAASTTALPGLPSGASNVTEAVARGNTLFYQQQDNNGVVNHRVQIHSTVHRYDLNAHAVLPGSADQGNFLMPLGSPGDLHGPGWDAAPDGQHVVYQTTTPATDQAMIGSEAMMYASADGSGASTITQYMSTRSLVRARMAPDGLHVGITEAYGTPDVLSACVNSPGQQGDPCLQFYSPDALGLPAWQWDSSHMYAAANSGNGATVQIYSPGHFNGAQYAANAYNPWSTP
ncbi:MAG TPA: hypothetical protein VGR57_01930 [Ktedonobacterales bacterium]|nr:hypothetical protein [Ktedonobacterales bacterium]